MTEEIYGENPKDAIQVNDVFNHESRLKALSSKLENVKDSKVQDSLFLC